VAAKKKGYTTFRTSRGAVVYVEAPEVYVAPSVTPEDLQAIWQSGGAGRQALRETLGFNWLGHEIFLGRDLNNFFEARWFNMETGEDENVDLNDYWTLAQPHLNNKVLTCPAGYRSIGAYSRRSFRYGHFVSHCKLPTLPDGFPPGLSTDFWMGFESEGGSLMGLSCFSHSMTTANPTGVLKVRIQTSLWGTSADITSLMPVDAQTTYHTYMIRMDRDAHWFYIDGKLVAVGVLSALRTPVFGPPPYAVFCTETPEFPSTLPAFVELDGRGYEITWEGSNKAFNVMDGEEKPNRRLDLYQFESEDLIRNTTINAGTLESHPIPTHGYDVKTIHFMADQNGTLNIEYYCRSGNWRAIPNPPTFVANELLTYNLLDRVPLIRVSIDPDAYPCSIAEAEVVLGP